VGSGEQNCLMMHGRVDLSERGCRGPAAAAKPPPPATRALPLVVLVPRDLWLCVVCVVSRFCGSKWAREKRRSRLIIIRGGDMLSGCLHPLQTHPKHTHINTAASQGCSLVLLLFCRGRAASLSSCGGDECLPLSTPLHHRLLPHSCPTQRQSHSPQPTPSLLSLPNYAGSPGAAPALPTSGQVQGPATLAMRATAPYSPSLPSSPILPPSLPPLLSITATRAMPKAAAGTPKAIANKAKSKGLQRLRWYCQMCEKQCRDENGFKCHTMSESHLRQMRVYAENPTQVRCFVCLRVLLPPVGGTALS